MENTTQPGILPDDGEAVPVGLPVVNHHREIAFPGQRELRVKKLLLLFLSAVIPVIVQANLSNGTALRMGQKCGNLIETLGSV